MTTILSILASALVTIGSFTFMVFGSKHLQTDECGLDVNVSNNTSKTLNFTACLANSGKELTDCIITRSKNKLFVDFYGRWFTGFSKFNEKFDYLLPDDINEIYLRGEKPGDTKLIWKRNSN